MVKKAILGVDPDEKVLFEIKKHPIGLYAIYTLTLLLFIVNFVALFFLVNNDITLGFGSTSMVSLIFLAIGVLILLVGYVASGIYRTNELIVTEDNIIQILQQSLFDRKVSQLNLAKIQDVTVDQEGVLPNVLNYGTLRIETAGETANYVFTLTPDPNILAKHIIETHDNYLKSHHSSGDTATPTRIDHRTGGV